MPKKNVSVNVATNSARAYCVGRNGLAPIKEVSIWQGGEGYSHIDGINRKGQTLNGGLCLDTEAMDKLAQEWLKARGVKSEVFVFVKGGLVQSAYGPKNIDILLIDDDNAESDPETAGENKLRNERLEVAKANGEVAEIY